MIGGVASTFRLEPLQVVGAATACWRSSSGLWMLGASSLAMLFAVGHLLHSAAARLTDCQPTPSFASQAELQATAEQAGEAPVCD